MAHIRKQPLVNAWGIGTGVAGILGAAYSTLCAAFDFNYKISFYVLLPLVGIYLLSYFCVLQERRVTVSNPLLDKPEEVECLNWSLLRRIAYYMATIDLVYFTEFNYVNTYYCVLTDGRLSEKEKELGTNWTALSVTAAVLVAAVFTYVSEQTYLQPFVPR
jgi:hypothetical protein